MSVEVLPAQSILSAAVLTPAPKIIPVNDDRLSYPADATKDHRTKINSYNDLLEDVFHRELEIEKLKASLASMRLEIVEEAQTLDPSGQVIVPASLKAGEADALSSGDEDTGSGSGEEAASDSANATAVKTKSKKRRGSKSKSKGKGKEATRKEQENWEFNWNAVAEDLN